MPKGKYTRTPRSLRISRPIVVVIGPSIAYVPLTKGLFALIDAESVEMVGKYNWSASQKRDHPAYAIRNEYSTGTQKILGIHRFLMGLKFSDPTQVDHKNRNPLDNRLANLRHCSPEQNHGNQGFNRNNTSGFKGAYQDKRDGAWFASIRICNRQIYLGRCEDAAEAHERYCEAAKKYKGEFANF